MDSLEPAFIAVWQYRAWSTAQDSVGPARGTTRTPDEEALQRRHRGGYERLRHLGFKILQSLEPTEIPQDQLPCKHLWHWFLMPFIVVVLHSYILLRDMKQLFPKISINDSIVKINWLHRYSKCPPIFLTSSLIRVLITTTRWPNQSGHSRRRHNENIATPSSI